MEQSGPQWLLWQQQADFDDIVAAVLIRRALKAAYVEEHHLGIGLSYKSAEAISLLLQLRQSFFVVGISYDFALDEDNPLIRKHPWLATCKR